jgi:hypothetical protein
MAEAARLPAAWTAERGLCAVVQRMGWAAALAEYDRDDR